MVVKFEADGRGSKIVAWIETSDIQVLEKRREQTILKNRKGWVVE